MKKIVYRLFLVLVFILRYMPKFCRRNFFKFIAYLAYIFAKGTNRVIEANLKFVYGPNISKEEIKEIQKYSYFNMVLWVQTLIENLDVSDEELKNSVQIENAQIIFNLKKENKPIIIISAHSGNIEMLCYGFNKFVLPVYQMVREANFQEIDDFIVNAREKSGAKMVFKGGALKKLIKIMTKKEIVSILIDQNVNSKDGIEVEFLGKKTYQTTTTAFLARKFDAYIVPVAIFNKDDYKYKIKVYEPIVPIKTQNEEDDIKKIVQLEANALSNIINEDKKQWFWAHKRFKNHNKEIYEKNFNNK